MNYARCCARKRETETLWVLFERKCDGSLKGRSYDVHTAWMVRFKVRTAVCLYITIWVAARGWA